MVNKIPVLPVAVQRR